MSPKPLFLLLGYLIKVPNNNPVSISHLNIFKPINEICSCFLLVGTINISENPLSTSKRGGELDGDDKIILKERVPLKEVIIPTNEKPSRGTKKGHEIKLRKSSCAKVFNVSKIKAVPVCFLKGHNATCTFINFLPYVIPSSNRFNPSNIPIKNNPISIHNCHLIIDHNSCND